LAQRGSNLGHYAVAPVLERNSADKAEFLRRGYDVAQCCEAHGRFWPWPE
jgi:hypothetical protein